MATISSTTSGNWGSPSTWAGGVVPALGDKVNILHTVTLDGTYSAGDDTSTAINIKSGGTLKASRSVSSQLTCRGNLIRETGGIMDFGKSSDPIPASVTVRLILNDSASPADAKWGAESQDNSQCWIYGAYKKTNTRIVYDIAAGSTGCFVEDGTGWEVGDTIVLGSTGTAINQDDVRVITTLTPISGTVVLIAWSGATSFAHAAKGYVGNFTRNVTIGSSSGTYRSYFYEYWGTAQTVNTREIRNAAFVNGTGATSGNAFSSLHISCAVNNVTVHPFISVGDLAFYTPNGGGCIRVANFKSRLSIADIALYTSSSSTPINMHSGAVVTLDRPVVYRAGAGMSFSYSEGGRSTIVNDGVFFGCGVVFSFIGGPFAEFNRCYVWSSTSVFLAGLMLNIRFNSCYFGSGGDTPVGAGLSGSNLSFGQFGGIGFATLTDCMFSASTTNLPNYGGGWDVNDSTSLIQVVNKNTDVTAQELYYPSGKFVRDNSVATRSAAAVRLDTLKTGESSYPPISISAVDGQPITIIGYLRKNTSYGSSTRPTVTLTGLGISTSHTMSDVDDTWEQFTLTGTPSAGYNGNLSLAFTGQSSNAAGQCWLSGIVATPFNGYVDHYGYNYDPANNARTVDPVVQLSESAAAALTGIAVVSGALTLTENHSIREVYDWLQWYRVEQQTTPLITSGNGQIFTLSMDLELDNCELTGTGTLNMQSNALTLTGTTASSIIINHDAGSYTAISVTGYTVGARLQLYDETADTELYNDIPSGSTLTFNAQWTTDHTIRLRMARTVGTDADLLIETRGILSATGASFLLDPQPDTVYEGNGIDGSTVTEFEADFPNVQIDINDPDGATTPQRGYAWYMAGQMTDDGLRYYHGAITGEDALNYRINVGVADMKIQNVSVYPVVIAGGRIYRSDGASVFAVGNGPIQSEPGKAYIADTGSLPTLAQIEASTVLAKEATVATRASQTSVDAIPTTPLLAANYTAPDNAGISAIAAKTNNLPASPAVAGEYTAAIAAIPTDTLLATDTRLDHLDADVSSRLATSGYTAPANSTIAAIDARLPSDPADQSAVEAAISAIPAAPSASTTATAVRTELATELARIDVAISTRLADADYTAPDNAGIAAIAAKLPSAGAKMAGEGATAKNLDDVSVDLSGLPTLAQIEASTVLAKEASVAAIPTTPLLAASYTAPDNAGIAAIKAKTDNLPADPASEATVAALPDAATIAAEVLSEAQTTPIYADMRKTAGTSLKGVGTAVDKFRSVLLP